MNTSKQTTLTPHAKGTTPANTALSWLTSALAATLMSACGGGGSGGITPSTNPSQTDQAGGTGSGGNTATGTPSPTLSPAQLQGRWQTASAVTPARTAIVLPGAASSTELWLLASDLSSLSRLQVSTSGTDVISASGQTYSWTATATNTNTTTATTSNASNASNPGQSATYSGTANLSNNTLSLNAGALLLTRSDVFTAPTNLADVQGDWRASVGSKVVTVSLNLTTGGTLSGTSSTGCTYSGTLAARSDASAYNASVTETCSGTSVSFGGIATYRAAQASAAAALTMALTSTDALQALVLGLQRP